MAGTSVRLLPKGGEPLDLEPATAQEDDSSVVVLDVSETLADGDYEVMWRAMAQDGHTIRATSASRCRPAAALFRLRRERQGSVTVRRAPRR